MNNFSNTFPDSFCLTSKGTESQVLRHRKAIVSVVLNTELSWLHLKNPVYSVIHSSAMTHL